MKVLRQHQHRGESGQHVSVQPRLEQAGRGKRRGPLPQVVQYLLRGPDEVPPEARLSRLIDREDNVGMTGFRESLGDQGPVHRRAGAVPSHPHLLQRGRRQASERRVRLRPQPPAGGEDVHDPRTTGLLEQRPARPSPGDGFVDLQHASSFLWWPKDQMPVPR